MKFNAGSKISSGGQPSRKRIIFDSDSEEDDLSGLQSPPDSGEEPEEPEGDDIPAGLEWLKKFKIPKSNKVFWTAEQLCNLKKNMPGLENFDDSILSAATLKELAIMSRQQLGGQKPCQQISKGSQNSQSKSRLARTTVPVLSTSRDSSAVMWGTLRTCGNRLGLSWASKASSRF